MTKEDEKEVSELRKASEQKKAKYNTAKSNKNSNVTKQKFMTIKRAAEHYRQEYIQWKVTLNILLFALFSAIVGIIFNVDWIYLIFMAIIGAVFYQAIIKTGYRKKYLAQRFSDINTYIEQLCYSFLQERNVYGALKDTYEVFPEGNEMKKAIKTGLSLIDNADVESYKEIESDGLEAIEIQYKCEKIDNTHKMLMTSQKNGGDPESMVDSLLKDRLVWEKANDGLHKKTDKIKTLVKASVIVTLTLCGVMIRLLDSLKLGLSISRVPLLEIALIIVYALDLLIIYKSENTELYDMNGDGHIGKDKDKQEKIMLEYYDEYLRYDEKASWKKAVVYSIIPLIITMLFMIFHKTILMFIFLAITILTLFSHKISHALQYRELVSEIRVAFPRWLMSINILVQNNNVYNSLNLSYDDAPAILKKEIAILLRALAVEPDSEKPFLDFLKDFEIPDIQSSMIMLYSAQRDMEHTTETIKAVLDKNLNIYEQELDVKYDQATGGMYILFTLPELTSSVKLLMDIMYFFIAAMATVGNF